MKTLRGMVKFRNIGMGGWGFETKDGDTYELIGGDESLLTDGKKAVIRGKIRDDLMSSGNFGPIFEVLESKDAT
jgi:hypothetical protein